MHDAVDELLQQALERDDCDWPTAFDELCQKRPDLATELCRRRDVLQRLGMLAPARKSTREFPERLGEFRLQRRIGGGGMGVVFLAEQERLGRNVALKVVRPELLFFAGSRERFRREAEAVARLKHKGIVPVYTVGEDGGIPYLVMEFVDGVGADRVLLEFVGSDPGSLTGDDLARTVCSLAGAPPPASPPALLAGSWTQAVTRVMAHLAHALAHAHEHGVLHRDIKPSNFMLTPDGRAVLIDFGLAAQVGATQLTQPGSQLGSLPYMAPERLEAGAAVDHRADVYALGITLHEMLTLTRPFDLGSASEVMRAVLTSEMTDPRAHSRQVSADLAAVVLKAVAKAPAQRYASAGALAADLEAVLAQRAVVARHATWLQRSVRWVRREPLRAVALLLSSLLLLGSVAAGGYYVASRPLTELGQRQQSDAQIELALAQGFAHMLSAGAGDDVAASFARAQALDATRADVAASAAFALLRANQAERALAVLQACPRQGPILDRVHGYVLQQLGRREEEAQLAATLPAPSDPRTHHFEVFLEAEVMRGAAARRGDEDMLRRALALFLDAAARAPAARLIYLTRIATTAGELRDTEHTMRATGAMAALWPDEPLVWLQCGIALASVAPARALEFLARLDSFPAQHVVWSNRGVALAQLGRAQECVAAFRQALTLAPQSVEAHVNLGYGLQRAGQVADAGAAFADALRLAPEHVVALYNLAGVQRDLGQLEESVATCRRLLAVAPHHVEGRNNLASVLMGLNRLDEAEHELRQVIAAKPRLPQGHSNLRRVLTRKQAWAECQDELRRWLSLSPDDAQAWRHLALVYSDERVPPELRSSREAQHAAQRAARLAPEDAKILFTLANALVANNQLADAEKPLAEALARAKAATPRDEKLVADISATLAELRAALPPERALRPDR
jgi:serine/threonine protein kinase/Flp pilus assembly protein TadD